jgi:hypothetical protein
VRVVKRSQDLLSLRTLFSYSTFLFFNLRIPEMGSHEGHAPQVVQPGLEVVPPEQRAKLDPYSDSDGPEAYSHGQFGNQNAQGRRNPFGLSPLAFGLLVGAVTAVIMSAALGGGIGGALASCQSQKSKYASTGEIHQL